MAWMVTGIAELLQKKIVCGRIACGPCDEPAHVSDLVPFSHPARGAVPAIASEATRFISFSPLRAR
jgi:hypothetical protein